METLMLWPEVVGKPVPTVEIPKNVPEPEDT